MSIGPSMPLRLEKPEGIDLAQAARYFGARGGADAATQALLEKCAVPLLAAATPRAVWLEADPDSLTAAGILAGEDVAKHLEGCTAALLLAVALLCGCAAQVTVQRIPAELPKAESPAARHTQATAPR